MLTCEWPSSKLTPAAVGSEGNENSYATLVDFCFVFENNGHLKSLCLTLRACKSIWRPSAGSFGLQCEGEASVLWCFCHALQSQC